jgi:adenosine/AMP kinase
MKIIIYDDNINYYGLYDETMCYVDDGKLIPVSESFPIAVLNETFSTKDSATIVAANVEELPVDRLCYLSITGSVDENGKIKKDHASITYFDKGFEEYKNEVIDNLKKEIPTLENIVTQQKEPDFIETVEELDDLDMNPDFIEELMKEEA